MNHLTTAQQRKLIEGIAAGRTTRIISADVPCSQNTVIRWRQFYRAGKCGGCSKPLHSGGCARKIVDAALVARMVSAREDEQLSTADIAARFNVSQAVVYNHLQGHPLKVRRRKDVRSWTCEEDDTMRRLYHTAGWPELLAAIPKRNRNAIYWRGADLGIQRPSHLRRKEIREVHPVIAKLAEDRYARRLRTEDINAATGICRASITGYELGNADPTFDRVVRWAAALGYELALVPLGAPLARPASVAGVTVPAAVAAHQRPLERPTTPRSRAMPAKRTAKLEDLSADRKAELDAMEKFLAQKGATVVPGVGDPKIGELPPLRWDPKVRRETRRPSDGTQV